MNTVNIEEVAAEFPAIPNRDAGRELLSAFCSAGDLGPQARETVLPQQTTA